MRGRGARTVIIVAAARVRRAGAAAPGPGVDAALIERFSRSGTLPAMHTDTLTPPDLAWQEEALCAQTGETSSSPSPAARSGEAKRICGLCPIRATCLEYALTHDMRFGVWGGLSEKERHALRRTDSR